MATIQVKVKHEWTFDLPWHMVDGWDWVYMVNSGLIPPVCYLHVRILGVRSLWMIVYEEVEDEKATVE